MESHRIYYVSASMLEWKGYRRKHGW